MAKLTETNKHDRAWFASVEQWKAAGIEPGAYTAHLAGYAAGFKAATEKALNIIQVQTAVERIKARAVDAELTERN
jgi:hypothetical protein